MNDDISRLISELEQGQKAQHEQKLANLENTRKIYHDQTANAANASGLLFSNYAPTKNLQYDAQKYYPAVATQQNNYLTTRDKIYEQGKKFKTQMEKLADAIKEANSDLTSGSGSVASTGGASTTSTPAYNPQAATNEGGKAAYDQMKSAVGNKFITYGTDKATGNKYAWNHEQGKMLFFGNDQNAFNSELAKYKAANWGLMEEK